MPLAALNAVSLAPHLRRCGYGNTLLASDYNFGRGIVQLAAFADTPHDARSVCIAAIDAPNDPPAAVAEIRPLGAPVVFACHTGKMQWWKQTTGVPLLLGSPVDARYISSFFDAHKADLSPDNIFEGKTRRRLPGQTQLTFVDAGLMPFVERTEGERLSRLVETALRDLEKSIGRSLVGGADAQNATKATFWLLAAKTLRDKEVERFKTVDLSNINDVFQRVGRHYGVPGDVPPPGRAWRAATTQAASRIAGFDSLKHLSKESLVHVYENTLITPEIRKANGTHSTPSALVDYMVWRLWPWIEALPADRRHVFEPACGHGAFLLSAMRVLRQWSNIGDGRRRHDYLKEHLHGVEYDDFAVEVAQLSLTLADVPHGNTWNLKREDMFSGNVLENGAQSCGVLLANPPFERFTTKERSSYARVGIRLAAHTKACEMLRRTIPHLKPGACFGVVVPQGFLHNTEGTKLRRTLLADFELSEIDEFADNLFAKSDHRVAVLLGRREGATHANPRMWYRRVREKDVDAFRDRFAFSSEEQADASRFRRSSTADFRVPELDAVWTHLSRLSVLNDYATLGQGLSHKGRGLPKGTWTIHDPPHTTDGYGYVNVPGGLNIYDCPLPVGINLDKAVVMTFRAGRPTGRPQVLFNYARVSRESWLLKATIDEHGRAFSSRFVCVRPKNHEITVVYLWALLNSPVANAFAFCRTPKQYIPPRTMQKLPMPPWSPDHAARIQQAAERYQAKATASNATLFKPDATPEDIRQALLEMDAAVLRAYDLPPRLERQLLDLFQGVERKGVGLDGPDGRSTFTGYYEPGFTSYLPLHLVISGRFNRAAADATADRFKPGESPHVRAALAAASTTSGEE